ncbi:unnamed protein product, partial [Prunus brigantina]
LLPINRTPWSSQVVSHRYPLLSSDSAPARTFGCHGRRLLRSFIINTCKLEQTTQLRQEQSQRSVPRPSNRDAEEQLAQGRPSTSRRLFVPTPAEHHQEYQVYSDCRDRINHRRWERQTSPIHVQANLNDRHLEVLGPKSPSRRRYAEVGLEETDESDYVPTSLGTTLSRQSTTIGSARRNDRRQGGPTKREGHLPGSPR